MRFNSPVFWLFLAVVVLLLGILPKAWRRALLLVASYGFYASWHWPYVFLLFGSATFTYFGARWIDADTGTTRKRRGWLVILVNLFVLFLFKYVDWAIGGSNSVITVLGFDDHQLDEFGWVLPLGISFYLFESSSYIFDVAKKREKLHGFWDVHLFIALFPKLIAGPIMRAKELMSQFHGELRPNARDLHEGLTLVLTGLFTKVVLADGIGREIDQAFARDIDSLGSTDLFIMAMSFGLQIYLDFSSYSRIAIGAARMCGIQLVENFNYPFNAMSPVDFWNRWHMSLSRWIRDYIYYPLVGSKLSLGSMIKATLISMTVVGIWHGAGWKFVVWGFLHGLLLSGYHAYRYVTRKMPAVAEAGTLKYNALCVLSVLTINGIMLPSWLFFRATDLNHALSMIGVMLSPWAHPVRSLSGTYYLHTVALMCAVWAAPFFVGAMQALGAEIGGVFSPRRQAWVSALGGATAGVLFALCLIFLRGKTTFIYFQF